MSRVTFDRFDGGLLLARPSSVAPANSLARLINIDVQPGGWLRSRAKFKATPGGFTLAKQWKGLESNSGYLWTFSCWNVASTGLVSAVVNLETGDKLLYAFYSTGTGGTFADAYTTRLMGTTRWETGYVAAFTTNSGVSYNRVLFSVNTATDTVTAVAITDVNMPTTGIMVTATERVYAISDNGLSVAFSKVGDPSNWTLAGNAGSLPVSRHFGSGQRAYGLGLYQGKLAVFTDQSIQLWFIDPDPTAMKLDRVIDGVGTRHHRSIQSLYGDLLFLSESGVRSLTTVSNSLFPLDVDIGLPIKSITNSPEALTRAANGGVERAVLALAAGPVAQYWVAASTDWEHG